MTDQRRRVPSTTGREIILPGSELRDRVRNALNESRMLVLGAQVLLGFQYQALFRSGFDHLPAWGRGLNGVALGLMLVAIACLLAPASFHRIAEGGRDTARMLRLASRTSECALAAFALAIGLDCALVTETVMGVTASALFGVAVLATAFLLWFGYELAIKRRGVRRRFEPAIVEIPLKDKIDQLLTEARVVLPGCQALLGFQFIAMLSDEFERLPPASRMLHVACLGLIALAMILLMAPAAYHRLVADGDATEDMDHFSGTMLLGALPPLGLALSGDFYIVIERISSPVVAMLAALGAILLIGALWLVLPLARRRRD
ncbi:MAG TPA: DUF6328 family protein [Aliidongia sp.]|nr:DUF6328 family protein [Aliidongia sp.]